MPKYHPANCVECTGILNGLSAIAVTLEYNGKTVTIPGLYRCTNCQGLIAYGIITSNINAEEAFDWLAGVYIPTGVMLVTRGDPRVGEAQMDRIRLRVSMAVDIAHELAELLGGQGPEDLERRDPAPLGTRFAAAVDSVEINDNMRATYQCSGCGQRHDVEGLFELLDPPQAEAA